MKNILSLLLLSAVALASAQNPFSLSITPANTDVAKVTAVFGVPTESETLAFPVGLTDLALKGETTVVDFSTNVDPTTFSYALLGTYGETGLTLGVQKRAADFILGKTWGEVFTAEAFGKEAVRAALDSSDFLTQLQLSRYLVDFRLTDSAGEFSILSPIGGDVTLINFSIGSDNGTAAITPVPEPATMAALACGLAGTALRRRRSSSKR